MLSAVTALWAAGAAQAAGKPDLIVSAETVATSVSPDVKMTATATVKNRGHACAGASRTDFFASADANRSGDDVRLNKKPTPALCAGRNKNLVQVLDLSKLPADLHSFYVIGCADAAHAVNESNESNNCRASRQLSLPYRVLVVTGPNSELNTRVASDRQGNRVDQQGVAVKVAANASQINAQFTPKKLAGFRVVAFVWTGTSGFLSDPQKAAFETYFHKGGGFVGIGSAIETEPTWAFLTTRSWARAHRPSTAVQAGTIKVVDRVHDATQEPPGVLGRAPTIGYNFTTNVRGVSHVLATVVEDPVRAAAAGQRRWTGSRGGTMGADHPVSWCKDYQGGRSFYTGARQHGGSFDAGLTTHLKGAINWAAGQSDPAYSDCGATVLANYQQIKVSGAAEPERADRLRPAPGRPHHPDRAHRHRAAARPGERHDGR